MGYYNIRPINRRSVIILSTPGWWLDKRANNEAAPLRATGHLLTNLMQGNPDQFIDEIAGYYIPEMRQINGFGLPTNLKALRAAWLKNGFENGVKVVAQLKKKDPSFQLTEDELNGWGYQLLSQKNTRAALAVFKLNVAIYPNSANAHDSLAETFESVEKNSEALESYKKSLSLDPKNKHAAERISALTKN